jgi:hypothetical protein
LPFCIGFSALFLSLLSHMKCSDMMLCLICETAWLMHYFCFFNHANRLTESGSFHRTVKLLQLTPTVRMYVQPFVPLYCCVILVMQSISS